MCSLSWAMMEGHDQGDLSDILRASCNQGRATDPALDWRFPSAPINFPLSIEEPINGFGDPFFSMQDPMPHDPNFLSDAAGRMVDMNVEEDESVGSVLSHWNNITGDQEVQMPRNSFSRMLQLSPDAKMPISSCTSSALTAVDSPAGITSTSFDHARMICPTTSTASSLVENGGQQIPSPRNLGIKRRKGQAKKVVCVPAPAPTSGRPGGEVVPSDLWAWRKYGQKPIKGSPYPRGYYRCSSTKGCSARKQVERSRTDPNMLVITYTSEHNHPWPTQRNALAGSSRSQHMKKDAHPKSSPPSPMPKPTVPKEEHKESDTDPGSSSEAIVSGRMELGTVKEERAEMEKSEEAIDHGNGKFDEGLEEHEDYKQSLKSDSNQSDDFFMDLGELEVDPIKLMFPQGMTGEKSDEGRENKGMDPFNLFDW